MTIAILPDSWKVMCGKRFTGIIETNYKYASKYWKERSRITGKKFKLVPVRYIEGVPHEI